MCFPKCGICSKFSFLFFFSGFVLFFPFNFGRGKEGSAFILEILIQDFLSLFKVSLEEQRIELGVSLLLSWRNRGSYLSLLPFIQFSFGICYVIRLVFRSFTKSSRKNKWPGLSYGKELGSCSCIGKHQRRTKHSRFCFSPLTLVRHF